MVYTINCEDLLSINKIIYKKEDSSTTQDIVDKQNINLKNDDCDKYLKYVAGADFDNKNGTYTKYIKDHDATINKIFNQISTIKSDVLNDNLIVITFDETVKFVDPLFFILLFDICSEYKSTLVIDVRYMNEKSQQYIHRLLTQYSDLEHFQVYSPYAKKDNKEIYITIDTIIKSDKDERERQFKRFLGTNFDAIHLFSNVKHKKSLINDNSTYEYTMLPILKLRNFELKDIDTTEHEDALEPYDRRILFYNQLSLDQSPKEYRKNLQNKINELLRALGLGNRGLSSSFRDIFFELIDNIRKHTPPQSNAHISFRKDTLNNLYELVVVDSSDRGFLDTYRETLNKEFQRLKESGLKKEHLQNYTDVTKDINSKHYEKVLQGLFQVQKSTLKDTDEEMHIHQIPRIAMHFGLPLLVKLLEKLSKYDSKSTPELKLFLHNNNQFFEITYSFKNGISTMRVNCNSSHANIGTCIIVTFPEDVKMLDTYDFNLTDINFKNSDYKLFIDKKDTIQKQINQFRFFLDKHIADDLDRSTKTIHTCEDKCVLMKFTGHNTFSEFLRNIYLYAYKHEVEDIVVTNVPLFEYKADGSKSDREHIEHIKLLETIIYGDTNAQYEKSLNVLFYSDRSPEAVLIGGRNQEEYCYLNNLLPKWYGGLIQSSICQNSPLSIKKLLPTKLFINIKDNDYILPFELFEISDEKRRNNSEFDKVSILGDMLEIYLNEVAKKDDVHIDTGTGYHINRYMEFKKVFEDSRWVRRLAFRLAMQFPKEPESKKYYLYGTDKYTNMLISLCYTFLDLTFDRFRYKLFNIYDDFDYDVLKNKIKALAGKNTHEIYLVSSVVVHAGKDIELMEDNSSYDIKAIPAIQLNIGNNHPKVKPLISIKSGVSPIKIEDDKYCHVCEGQRKEPLLEFTEKDPFFIKDTFFDKIPSKKIKSFSSRHSVKVHWFDSLNFGHVERGNNHFLYYINTIKFFNQNRDSIKEFLEKDVSKKIGYKEKENIILFTSSHDTNNNFVALVNQEVFNNDAIVLSFNKSRGEANFHDLDSYGSFDWVNTRVFFVDDSIASSHTVKYFYQMLRTMPTIMDTQNVGLDGMIVMIDRISSYDETILCGYLRDGNHEDKSNDTVLKEKLGHIYAFTTFDIKPIKSEVEECFLCSRNKRYLELAKKSALDLTTFQMVRRAYKLRTIEYRAIQPAKEKTLVVRFKNYLKAMATIYVYQNFIDKRCKDFGKFDELLQSFSEKMHEDILKDKKNRFEKYDQSVLKKIIEFQSEIALIKALSFPRLSYYYEIRKWLIPVVLDKLKAEVNKIITKDFDLKYKFEDKLDKPSEENFDEKDIEFLKFYKNMTNLHLPNVYFATLGYLQDSKILDTDYIQFFYKVTQCREVRKYEGDSLLHTYPFAVKFTIADNLEKSIYFEKNIDTVLFRNNVKLYERKKKDSYINALKLENTLFWKDFIKRKTEMDIRKQLQKLQDDNDIDNKINIIKSIFQKIFSGSKVYLFISPYAPISGGTYPSYLDSSTQGLINILDSFSSIDYYNEQISEMVKKVFYGALDSSNDSEETIHLKKADKKNIGKSISDTWSNDYDDTYCVVRLTTIDEDIINNYDNNIIDNEPIWFKPIGCIVVEDSQMDYMYHMEISRTVLSIKNYISYYLEQEFNYGVIQEAIMKLQFSEKHNNLQKETGKLKKEKEALEQENETLRDNIIVQGKSLKKREKDFEIRLEKLSHSLTRYINLETPIDVFIDDMKEKYQISKCKDHDDFIEIMRTYSYGMMLHTGLQETKTYADKNGKEEYDIYEVMHEENFKKWLLEFISTASTMHNTLCPKCNTKTLDFSGLRQGSFILKFKSSSESTNKKVSQDFMEYIIFELVFNAMKAQEGIDNPYIKLYSLNSDKHNYRRGICIENAVSKNFDCDDFKEKLENNELGMGIKSLTKIVEAQNYKLEHVCEDNIFKVSIKHEEGK